MLYKKLLIILILYTQSLFVFSDNRFDNGTFISSEYIQNDNFLVKIKKKGNYKTVDYSSICLEKKYNGNDFGYFAIDGMTPFFIKEWEESDNKINLKVCGMNPFYTGDLVDYIKNYSSDLLQIEILIIDNDEIFLDFPSVFKRKQHLFRISSITDNSNKEAVLNDSRVRLRIKPNLDCGTWGYLNKGDKVIVKDISSEQFEIDGESWYWYKVDYPELPDGWVYGKYLDIENN